MLIVVLISFFLYGWLDLFEERVGGEGKEKEG